MHAACTEFRDEALALDLDGARASEHARSCASCAAWALRTAREARALRGLPRQEVPFELDGRVVASLEAGGRQDRAVGSLGILGRVEPPLELDRAVDAEFESLEPELQPHRAPAVLDRLVSEELADPAKTRARRFLGSLERMSTPAELDARVDALLRERDARPPSRRVSGRLTGLALAAAAVLLVWFVAPPDTPEESRSAQLTGRYDFELQEGSLDGLPGVASGLLQGVLGGGLDLRREL